MKGRKGRRWISRGAVGLSAPPVLDRPPVVSYSSTTRSLLFRAGSHPSRLRELRRLAGLVATFCLLGQLSTLAHNILVRHATCAEHGELVHQSTAPGATKAISAARRDVAVRASAADDQAEGHGHEHCLVLAHGRGHVGLDGASAPATVEPPEYQAVAPVAAPARAASHTVYRLAPKTSPPA